MLPSAALNPGTRLLIGAGVLVNPQVLISEIATFGADDRTFVDGQCGIIEQSHIERDKNEDHLKTKVGTTGTGTGPANSDRALRTLKLAKDVPELSLYIEDVSNSVNYALDNKERVIVEGTQGTYLSLFHGGYPYVTSKDVTASGICSDVGIGPKRVDDVLVVFKAYVTRVGGGPLQNELVEDEAKKRGWMEYGSVTGRQRRTSPFDMDLAKKSIRINSATELAVTKLDVLYPQCAGMTEYSGLPAEARKFIEEIEGETGLRITLIGTGPDLYDVVDRRS
jgi:adenylosuccinate synthase